VPSTQCFVTIEGLLAEVLGVKVTMVACSPTAIVAAGHRQRA
jgi:hypothetical protein